MKYKGEIMGLFTALIKNINEVIWPDIQAKYMEIMGINPLGLDGKVDKVLGKGLSQEDFITALKNKLEALDSAEYEKFANKGVANGYAPLGADGKINPSYLSSMNITDIWPVADEPSMLALSSAGKGDYAIRADTVPANQVYMLITLPSSTLANWLPMNFTANVTSVNGMTGIVVLGKADVGLGNVDNTSDANKPLSLAAISALALKADQSAVDLAIANLVASSPAALDTLNELAAALGDDANFATTMTNALSGKQAALVSGTNIKTLNNTSLLGAGNIVIDGDMSGVRQTIQSASVDGNGFPNFCAAGVDLSVNIFATAELIKIHAAGGDTNRLVKLLADMTISGLAANALNYCYFDVAADGTITGGATVVPPEYIDGVPNTAFPTWDSTTKGSGINLTNGDLTATKNATVWANSTVYSGRTVKSGKFYAEVTVGATSNAYCHIGVSKSNTYQGDCFSNVDTGYSYLNSGNKVNTGSPAAYGATYTIGDVIGVMYDAPTGQITFYKNNVSQGVAFTVAPYTPMYLAISHYATGNTSTANYGSSAFTYSLPSGASAWNDEILNGRFIFSIAEMKAYVGNGSAAPQAYRVFFAEALCGALSVISVVNYALNGMYTSPLSAYSSGATTAYAHNIGTQAVTSKEYLKCIATNLGYAFGEEVDVTANGANGGCNTANVDRNTSKVTFHSTTMTLFDRSTFGASAITTASWNKFMKVKRDF